VAGTLLLGVDIGTYSSKGVICSPDGDLVASAQIEHDLSIPRAGWAEHDAETIWWGEFVGITRSLLSKGISGADIGGVAVSAIGPCLLPVDKRGTPLRPGILYGIDTRAANEIDDLTALLGEDQILDLGGMTLTTQSVGPKILWLRRNEPEVFASTHKFLTASSYLIHRLTGEYVIDRHTGSYFTPFFDIKRLEWDGRYAEGIVDLATFPRLLWSTDIAGVITNAAARETGLNAGTPVTGGAVDAAAEAVSVGVDRPGDMMVMYGTTMFFILVTANPLPDRRMWATAYCFEGLFDVAGGMATTGALTRWFRDQLAGEELASERAGGPSAYQALAERAGAIAPGSDGLICLPYFSGERTPINDPQARGMFAGLTLAHTRGHLYRAALEGTAYGVRHNLETLREMGANPERIVAVGGGAQNSVWLQIVSDVIGVPQVVPARTVGASYGDAFLAGLATGLVDNLQALNGSWVEVERMVEPNSDLVEHYAEYYDIYRRIYRQTVDEMHELAHLSERQVGTS
jgi:xylulokinase